MHVPSQGFRIWKVLNKWKLYKKNVETHHMINISNEIQMKENLNEFEILFLHQFEALKTLSFIT